MGAKNDAGVDLVLEHLFKDELLEATMETLTLSFDGWKRFEEMKRSVSETRKAFMAMKFNDPEIEGFFDLCLKPAVEKTGFRLVHIGRNPKEGSIDERIIAEIRTSRFVVADLTHGNQGAYWEAGVAKGLGKPVFYTCLKDFFDKKGDYTETGGVHFDTRQQYIIVWEKDKFDEATKNIKATIRNSIPDAKMEDE